MPWQSIKQWLTTPNKESAEKTSAVDPKTEYTDIATPCFVTADTAFVQNPYSCFAQLQREAPLYRTQQGAWVLTRYADVLAGLSDSRLINTPAPYAVINQRNRDKYTCADVANNTLPFMAGESHAALRKWIAICFRQRMQQHTPDFHLIAETILKPSLQHQTFDVLHDYGTPLALTTLCEIMGFPQEDHIQLKRWSHAFFYLFTSFPSIEIREETDAALQSFRAYIKDIMRQRQQTPGNDFISDLLHNTDATQFDEQHLIDNCMLIFADGLGNVDTGLANVIYSLLQHPQVLAAVYAEPALIPQAVSECLRYESPSQFIARIAAEDITWHGQIIKKNQAVLLILAAANRDPEQFKNPHQLSLNRTNSHTHLSFGKHAHACLGAYLVKLQLEAALSVLLKHTQGLQLTEKEVTWQHRPGHRWLQSLPVSLKSLSR